MAPFVLLLALQASADAGPRPVVAVPRLEAEIRVDGVLDEPAWASSATLDGFHQFQPVDGRPAEEQTQVRAFYTPSAICFGIVARDREPGAIRATVADRDNIDQDDHVILFLDTFNDRRRAFFFAVNPLGVQQDGVRTEGAVSPGQVFGGETDKSPDFVFDSKGRVGADGYVVEVRIPFKSLRYRGGSAPQQWGFNVQRRTQRTGYVDTWTDVRRASASFLAQAGALDGLHDLHSGMVVEAQPFLTATADGARDAPSDDFRRQHPDLSAGLNVRLGVTPDVSLDATLNPDFSQVESDLGLVTVNERFALFFPEKRPFFLEGIELFATPNQLVYTRRVVDPIAGGKLTAKRGRFNLAHLTALDDAPGGHALFNVTRLRTDYGESSTAGLTLTDRAQGEGRNTVFAADTRCVFGKLYFLQGQLGGARTRDDSGTRTAPLWLVEFDRTGRAWGFNYRVSGIGEGFESRAGFVPRNGIVEAHGYNRGTLYGRRGALLESLNVYAGPQWTWRYRDFLSHEPLEGAVSADFVGQLRGGWQVRGHAARQFVHHDPRQYAGYAVDLESGPRAFVPRDLEGAWGFFVGGSTPAFRWLDADANLTWGRVSIFAEGSEGRERRWTATLNLRGGTALRMGARLTLSRITRDGDGSEFARTLIPRLKVEYQPRRSLFVRVVAEYQALRRDALRDPSSGRPLLVGGLPQPRDDSNRLRVDVLASYEPTPGSVAFLGYGADLDNGPRFGLGSLARASDGFFLKLAYRLRR